MRIFSLSLIGISLVALAASAQPQPQFESLDTALRGWEKAMTDLKSFVGEVERINMDKALGTRDDHKGYAMFLKPAAKDDGSRARLEMGKVSNPSIQEKYICTGTYLYEYAAGTKTIRVHSMPQNNKQGMQESFLSFLFGMSAEQAKSRYHMKLEYPIDEKTKKEFRDPNYHYIRIWPKNDQDKSDFIEARLSLYRTNSLPAQIWYLAPNKNVTVWNFSKLQIDVQIPVKFFEPDQPAGWRVERVQPKPGLGSQPTIRP